MRFFLDIGLALIGERDMPGPGDLSGPNDPQNECDCENGCSRCDSDLAAEMRAEANFDY